MGFSLDIYREAKGQGVLLSPCTGMQDSAGGLLGSGLAASVPVKAYQDKGCG